MRTTLSEDAFFIDRDRPEGLQMQLRQAIASSILAGRLRGGDRMPSSRKLAQHLKISRITVTLAYQELIADGYLESRDRSGYFVADTAPVLQNPAQKIPEKSAQISWDTRFVRRASGLRQVEKAFDWRRYDYPFIYGQADLDLFNHSAWRACAHRALGRRDFDSLAGDYVEKDDPELVDFIARQTLPRRGIAARPEEILITLGAQNALWLVSHLLLGPGRMAILENPGYPGLRDVLAQSGAEVVPTDVDEDGLPPDRIPPAADVVFATPSHQAPTTVTMSMDRRRELLKRAARDDFVIVEDDYEFELSFLRAPFPALRSMDDAGRVIYVGSFSKSLFPGLRLGYMVAPEPFIQQARALRTTMLRHPPGHIQRTTAYFLALGHYDALIRRMRDAFQIRRQAMADAITDLGLTTSHASNFGGTSFWMEAPVGTDTDLLAERVRADGVLIEPGGPFFAGDDGPCRFYRLGYSSIDAKKIRPGLARLKDQL